MLDQDATRRRFTEWVRSPGYDAQFDATVKRTIWPFVLGGLLIVSMVGIPAGIGLVIYGFIRGSKRSKARKSAHLSFSGHEPVACVLVIGNTSLFGKKGAVAPALLVGGFGKQDDAAIHAAGDVAMLLAGLYGEDPEKVAPAHRIACELVNDDTFRPDRRRPVPPELSAGRRLWLFDAMLMGDHFDSRSIDEPVILCMATPGDTGSIVHCPAGLAEFREEPYDPNIIHHKPRSEPPPLVAPVSENLDAIEKHIETHLGEPSSVFHEMISTTVHIDVHVVRPTPERPWISLVTSGMSDLPMNAPEGAEDWRFAELMMRLPADWKLDEESFKDEANYWPLRWLKMLARFAHEAETWLSYGHSIPNGNPPAPFADGVAFTGMLLSVPWYGGEEFSTLRLADGTAVRFWSLVPLHSSEIDFKLKHGADELFEKLAAAGYSDLFAPSRPPLA